MLRNMNSRFAFYPSRFVCVLQLKSVFPCVTMFCEARKLRARKSFSGRTSMRRRSFRPRNPACCQSRLRNRRRETRRASSRGRETVSAASVGLENSRARCPGHRARAFSRPEVVDRVQLQITCKFILKAKVENFLSTVRKTANVDYTRRVQCPRARGRLSLRNTHYALCPLGS